MNIALLAGAHKIHTWRWATAFAARGHEVRVFSDNAAPPSFDYGAISVVQPEWTMLQNMVSFYLFHHPLSNNRDKWRVYTKAINSLAPDILHAHEAIAYGPMLAHFPQYASVLTPWGPDVEALDAPDVDPLYRQLLLDGARAATLLSTNAPGLEARWERLLGIPANRMRFFPWGVNPACFHPRSPEERAAIRHRLAIPEDATVYTSPRLANPLYGIDMVLEGWGRSDVPGVLVVLRAGAKEEQWKKLLELAATAPEDRLVVMVGETLTPDEMAALYSTSIATIMIPTNDLVAMSLLESMACGSIPIVYDLPCYRAVVTEATPSAPPPPERGLACFAARSPDGIAAALHALASTSPAVLEAWRDHNLAYIGAHATAEFSTQRMEAVLHEAHDLHTRKA